MPKLQDPDELTGECHLVGRPIKHGDLLELRLANGAWVPCTVQECTRTFYFDIALPVRGKDDPGILIDPWDGDLEFRWPQEAA